MSKLINKIHRQKKNILIGAAVIAAIAVCIGAAVLLLHEEEMAEPSLEEVLQEKLTAYETDLRDSLGSMDTNADVAGYLLSWAKNKEIPATTDEAGNVIFTIKASENAGDASPSAIVCSFDAQHMDYHIEEMAVALCVAKNVVNHGKLSIVFLAEENGQKTGVQGFDVGHFTDDTSIFCLGNSVGSRVSTVTGGYRQIQVTHKLEYQKPTYNKAFKITLKNCPSLRVDGDIGTVPNPIKVLGNVLANFKSTSLLFELGTFYGGSNADFTPSKASMTVVINDSDIEKFQRKMENSIEKIYEKYHEDYPDIEYTYEEVDLPSHVLDTGDTDNLVSLMYTVFDGIYQRDDEGVITAITNIGRISCKNHLLKIQLSAMSSDQTLLNEICESYETICGLCDVKFRVKKEYPVFYGLTGRPTGTTEALRDSFEESFKEFTGDSSMKIEDTAVLTACTFLRQKNENLAILYCGITEKTKHKFSGSLITWLDQGAIEEE